MESTASWNLSISSDNVLDARTVGTPEEVRRFTLGPNDVVVEGRTKLSSCLEDVCERL